MAHNPLIQGLLFPEEEFTKEGREVSFGKPVIVSPEDCAVKFRRALLAGGGLGRGSLLEQLFRFMELRGAPANEEGDALTIHLCGFAPNDLPKFTNNECKTLGNIFEEFIVILYSSAYPGLYSKDFSELARKVEKIGSKSKINEGLGKWAPDFLIELVANEIKYRSGNGQGSTEQARGAVTLNAAGYLARMLFFRSSPNAAKYDNAGWDCTEGEDTISRIWKETGVDIVEVIDLVGRDPQIALRRDRYRQTVMAREVNESAYRLQTYGGEMVTTNRKGLEKMKREIDKLLSETSTGLGLG
jgi:hypothetical protein